MMVIGWLEVPDGTSALLLDMDGVVLDTLTYEYEMVTRLLRHQVPDAEVPTSVIRQHFALPIPEFWLAITGAVGVRLRPAALDDTVNAHVAERSRATFAVHAGIPELIRGARAMDIVVAVVSNNPVADISKLLEAAGISIDILVGNDQPGIRSKPAPDMYLEGARRTGFPPARCVAIEDSLLGAEAAARAGCHVVAVATGANTLAELAASGYVWRAYEHLGSP
jgi:HAD superfamily hydrolase (TIGR01509 family)